MKTLTTIHQILGKLCGIVIYALVIVWCTQLLQTMLKQIWHEYHDKYMVVGHIVK